VAPGLLIKPEEVMEIPHTVYVNNFDEESSKLFLEDFTRASNSFQPIIPIIIDSYGGDVYSLLSMIDVIENSSKPVATVCVGKAMSCGAILLSCGHKGHRYIGNHATVMIHDVSAYSDGKFEEVKSNARETTRLQKEMFNILDKNADKFTGYFDRLVFRRGRKQKTH
jgi:ATP-dependent Clp protease protease subunit